MTSLLNPEKWVDLHGDILFRFAMMRVGNPETASELVQETFLAALKSSSQFKGKSSETRKVKPKSPSSLIPGRKSTAFFKKAVRGKTILKAGVSFPPKPLKTRSF